MDFGWGLGTPFQMDANFGIPAAITEMLCGGNSEIMRILPALPKEWRTGEFHDVLTRAGVKTSASWDMDEKNLKISLSAERNTTFDLKLPGDVAKLKVDQSQYVKESQYGDSYRAITLEKGDSVAIQVTLK